MIKTFLNELKKSGWKQKEISDKTGIAQSFISKLSKGGDCSTETLVKFANAFDVTTDEILGRIPPKPRSPIVERIEQIAGNDDGIARAALKYVEDQKLIKEMRGEKTQRRKAA